MLRRVVAVLVLAGVAVACGIPLLRAADGASVAGSRAVRLVGPGGTKLAGPWQGWANASLVPTVTGRVTVRVTGCPGFPRAAGCVYSREPRVVYLRRNLQQPRAVLLHELGHVYDLTVLSNSDRGKFRRIMRRSGVAWWKGRTPLAEWFAEAYAWCARYKRIVSLRRYAIHGYHPTPAQHRSVCALIRRAAIDKTPPKRPSAPPIVTGDPAPPAAPPATAIPGESGRGANSPAPAVTPQPKAASTPAATPPVQSPASPTPTATPRFPRRTPTPTPAAPTATPTPTPTPTSAPTYEPTSTLEPTAQPEPTAAPDARR